MPLNSGFDDLHHAQVSLNFGGQGGIFAVHCDPRKHLRHGADEDVGLPQAGQHVVYVVHEGLRGADYQYPARLQLLSVGVEQVGGPVQGDGAFARPGPSLHHHGRIQGHADYAVLLPLDGGDDVAHLSGAALFQRRHEGPFAAQYPLFEGLFGFFRAEVQKLVFQLYHLPVFEGDVAPQGGSHVIEERGLVEGACGLGPPVEQNRLFVFQEAHAPYVALRSVFHAELSENQPVLSGPERGEPVFVHGRKRIPLRHGGEV